MVAGKTRSTRWDPTFDDKPYSGPHSRFVKKFSNKYLDRADYILDAGCGVGNYLHMIDKKGCFGVDLDIYAIGTAKKYCVNSDFLIASVLDLPFRDNTFNVVAILEVIEHLPIGTEKKAIAEVKRILSCFGIILLSTPNHHFLNNIMDPAFLFRGHRHYKIEKVMELIIDVGFSIEEYVIRGGLGRLLFQDIFYFNKHVLHRRRGRIQDYFEKKAGIELDSNKEGIVDIFIAARKIN